MAWRLFAGVTAVMLAVWTVIGAVLALEAICGSHATVLAKAGLLTLLAYAVIMAVAFIVLGPLSDARDGSS